MKKIQLLFYYIKTMFLKLLFLGKNVNTKSIIKRGFYFEKISRGAKLIIGKGFYCRNNCSIINGGNLSIGNSVFLNHNVSITCLEKISIGDNVTIGNNVIIVDHDHSKENNGEFLKDSVIIGDRVWIGANAVILRGTKIENGCIIAANSIVKGIVPSNSIFYNRRENVCVKKNK